MNSGELHRKVMGSALNPVTRRLKSIHTAEVTAESHINVGIRRVPLTESSESRGCTGANNHCSFDALP